MKADDIYQALSGRWHDSEYICIREAPEDSARMGRKIDLLVLSVWSSRGYEIDAVEVKVSLADARREIEGVRTKQGLAGGPAKAEFWYAHSHRFWLAVPDKIAAKVLEEMPELWGLLAVTDDGKLSTKRKAPKHEPQPLEWSTVVGLMRASADAGIAALGRARSQGYESGRDAAKSMFEHEHNAGIAERKLRELEANVAAFKEASGIDITAGRFPDRAEQLGAMVAAVQSAFGRDPDFSLARLERASNDLRDQGESLAKALSQLREILGVNRP